MELELKHLLAYFPYGVKALVSDLRFGIGDPFLDKITGMYEDLVTFNDSPDWYFDSDENDTEIKLALRPLSDLTKQIKHNGEKFVPIDYFEIGDDDNETYEYDNGNINLIQDLEYLSANRLSLDIVFIPYGVIQKFLEWHFDIFGLIEKGLAIDINALNK